jgi:hypothetical protein
MAAELTPAAVGGPLDLCRPPDGFCFRAGVWLSHDVDMAMVADTVAPVLAGTSDDPDADRRRRLAAYALNGEATLLVLGNPSRLGQVPAFPWTTFVPVKGRVLHAKCAVLQFAKADSPKRITRAFVTSANLTRGSLSNREVLLWEESGSLKASPTLACDLIAAMKALTADLDIKDRGRTRRALRELAAGLARSRPARCTADSLVAEQPLLAGIAGRSRKPADRLVIVSPPFAGDGDRQAAGYLTQWVGPRTHVDVFTGVEAEQGVELGPNCRPAFSRTVLKMLRDGTPTGVQVWGVPSYDSSRRRRRLHAKVFAIVRGDNATVVAGSANCSGRGLSGKNRELVARQDWSAQRLDEWLAELGAIAFSGDVSSPEPRAEPPALPASLVNVAAAFEPERHQTVRMGKWPGVLRLSLSDPPGALRLTYRDSAVEVAAEQPLVLWEREAWLIATTGTSRWKVPIAVRSRDNRFWEVPRDQEDEEDPLFLALLRALRPPSPAPSRRKGGTRANTAKAVRHDDRYRIEPRRALTLLAHNRVQLHDRLVDGIGQNGRELFDPSELPVAEALLRSANSSTSLLLASLGGALDDFDAADE